MDITEHFDINEDNKDLIDLLQSTYGVFAGVNRFYKAKDALDARKECPVCLVELTSEEHNCMKVFIPDGTEVDWITIKAEAERLHNEWLATQD